MSKQKDDNLPNEPLTNHEYDGIHEFDNPLPGWWLMTFFGTIIFGFIYALHFMIMPDVGLEVEFKSAWNTLQTIQETARANTPAASADELAAALADPAQVQAGAGLFAAKCAACHGAHGEGMVGPNLTDKFWIHGKGTPTDVLTAVAKGVLEKGMPAWENMISKQELTQVVAFVNSIHNTNLPGKAPQGDEAP